MIAVIDYGMGNLRSVSKALSALGARVTVTSNPRELKKASKLVLPGVGEFGNAMAELKKKRLIEPILDAIKREKPFLGICLGLQLLLAASEESKGVKGLGVLNGKVKRLKAKPGLKIPQMGWNQVSIQKKSPLLKGLKDNSYFYFVHSYYADPVNKQDVLGITKYGQNFASILEREPIFAVQFHPEKSQKDGTPNFKKFYQLLMITMETKKETVKIIPAIDLRGGQVVRLTRGDFAQETVYSNAPEQVAAKWKNEGAELIHVVDLDGALTGRRKNLGSLKNICAATKMPTQFGGGLRTLKAVEEVFATGVTRAVIGTKALDLKLLKQLVKRFGDRIVVGLDIKNSQIQVQGWIKSVSIVTPASFCEEIDKIGVRHVVFTDVSRDGTLLGPNTHEISDIFGKTKLNVIVSGGIGSLDDLRGVAKMKHEIPNIYGVIVGKALYEKKFELSEPFALSNANSPHYSLS